MIATRTSPNIAPSESSWSMQPVGTLDRSPARPRTLLWRHVPPQFSGPCFVTYQMRRLWIGSTLVLAAFVHTLVPSLFGCVEPYKARPRGVFAYLNEGCKDKGTVLYFEAA